MPDIGDNGASVQRHTTPSSPAGKGPVIHCTEVGWAPKPVWKGVKNRKFLTTTGIQTANWTACSGSLRRLRYSEPFYMMSPPQKLYQHHRKSAGESLKLSKTSHCHKCLLSERFLPIWILNNHLEGCLGIRSARKASRWKNLEVGGGMGRTCLSGEAEDCTWYCSHSRRENAYLKWQTTLNTLPT